MAERDKGLVITGGRESFADYLDSWLDTVKPRLRPRTHGVYAQIVRDHLKPALGRAALSKIQPQHLERVYQNLLAEGKSPKTVRNVHGVVHRALDQAFRWRLISSNPADLIDPPRYAKKEMTALTSEEARLVLRTAKDDDLNAL